MFNSDDFKQIINNTTDLLDQIKTAPEDDVEEIQLRIDSNVHALQIVGAKITDPELRLQAEKIIKSLHTNIVFDGGEKTITRIRQRAGGERSDLVAKELYKSTLELKRMARGFGESLKSDKQILCNVTDKMSKNSVESTHNMKFLEENVRGIGTSTYLFLALIMFVVMYLIIKFL